MKHIAHFLIALCAAVTIGAAGVALGGCGEGSAKAHTTHAWSDEYEVQTPATCTTEGLKVRHCLYDGCTEVDELVIPATGHSWGKIENTATCEEGGHKVQKCKNPGCTEQKELEETPALGHKMTLVEELKAATCTDDGLANYKCSRCDYTELEKPIEKLGHFWVLDYAATIPAKCTTPGKNFYTCSNDNCDSTKEEEVPMTGHKGVYSDVKYATFESDGRKVGVCSVCHDNLDIYLPKLEEGKEIEYEFKVCRKNGNYFFNKDLRIEISDPTGKVVASAGFLDLIGGVYYVNLPVSKNSAYTMKVTGLGSTYRYEPVTVLPEKPVGDLYVYISLIPETEAFPEFYDAGFVMQNFVCNDIKGNPINLKDVLKKNKAVMFNFFYTFCGFCVKEFPGLVKAYEKYKRQGIEVIGLACPSFPGNSTEEVLALMQEYGLNFPVLNNEVADNIKTAFDFRAAPVSVYVDHEGMIDRVEQGIARVGNDNTGATSQQAFELCFQSYCEDEWSDMESSEQQTSLITKLLRCDYQIPSKDE